MIQPHGEVNRVVLCDAVGVAAIGQDKVLGHFQIVGGFRILDNQRISVLRDVRSHGYIIIIVERIDRFNSRILTAELALHFLHHIRGLGQILKGHDRPAIAGGLQLD